MARKVTTIIDLGEKIGGARKDRAVKTGPRTTKPKVVDSRPAWARRYDVNQIVSSTNPREVGKWSLRDTLQKDWRGQAKLVRTFATEAEARDAIPLHAVARNHTARSVNVAPAGSPPDYRYEIWRKVTDRKNVRVVSEQFASRESALAHMAQNAQKIIETKTGFGEEILAKPDIAKRVGPDVRSAGNIAGEAFMKSLGMRGVEFGNWQGDRQHVMNHAYDAFQDLGHVTGIDPRSLSLNSDLGVAFGARGSGLSSARAHYERDFGVINLTKMEGSGALAHEWFHGLDHMLGRVDDPKLAARVINNEGNKVFATAGRDQDFGSHRVSGYVGQKNLPETVRSAYKALVDAMYHREEQYTEDAAKVQKFSDATAKEVDDNIKRIRDHLAKPYEYAKKGKPATEAQLKRFDDLAAKIKAGSDQVTFRAAEGSKTRFGNYHYTSDTINELSKLHKEVRGRTGFDSQHKRGSLDELAKAVARHQDRVQRVEEAASQSVKTRRIPTEFAREAHKLDEGRVTDYWQTKHEMAARAFSAYVEDKLQEHGRQSDYLSFGSDNKYYRMMGMKPFPEGGERAAINAKFDDLFKAMRESGVVKPAAAGVNLGWSQAARDASLKVRQENAASKAPVEVAKASKTVTKPATGSKTVSPKAKSVTKAAKVGKTVTPSPSSKDFNYPGAENYGPNGKIRAETRASIYNSQPGAPNQFEAVQTKEGDWVVRGNQNAPMPVPQTHQRAVEKVPTHEIRMGGMTNSYTVRELGKTVKDAIGKDRVFRSKSAAESFVAERERIANGTKRVGDTVESPVSEVKPASQLDAFAKTLSTPRAQFNAKAAMNMQVRVNGKEFMSRAAMIESRVKAGATVDKEKGRLINPDGTFLEGKNITTTGLKYAEHLIKFGNKLGAAAMIAAPATAALLAYDAAKSKASAAGRSGKDATISAGKAAVVAGGTTAAIGLTVAKALSYVAKGAEVIGPVAGKVAARAVPGLGIAAMAYGAFEGYRHHGIKGAVLGIVGADALLDRPAAPSGNAGFNTANAAFNGMQATKTSGSAGPRGFANATVQAAAQAARGHTFHGFQNGL